MIMKKTHEKDKPNEFILFPNNNYKEGGSLPKWIGKVMLEDGTVLRMAAWENKLADGRMYLGGKVNKFMTKEEVEQQQAQSKQEEPDIDLPF